MHSRGRFPNAGRATSLPGCKFAGRICLSGMPSAVRVQLRPQCRDSMRRSPASIRRVNRPFHQTTRPSTVTEPQCEHSPLATPRATGNPPACAHPSPATGGKTNVTNPQQSRLSVKSTPFNEQNPLGNQHRIAERMKAVERSLTRSFHHHAQARVWGDSEWGRAMIEWDSSSP